MLRNFLRPLSTYTFLAIFVLLAVVFTAQVGSTQVVTNNPGPNVVATVVATQTYDNFESYGGTLPVTNWPTPGGYMINPWGDPNSGFFPSLNTDYKADGNYSMQLGYNLEGKMWNSMGHLLDQPDWSAWDGVRYWVKPDGSGRVLNFGFLEHVGSDGVKNFYGANYQMQMTDTTPVIVNLPWSAFGADKTNVSGVEEQIWSVEGPPGPGTIYVDKIELIKIGTASPSGVAAGASTVAQTETPAPLAKGPNVVATQTYDNFESYGNTLSVTNWPTPGGYMIKPWGDPNSGFFPSLNTAYKADGNYSMQLGYNLESKGWNSMGYQLNNQDWSAWDGVRYWVKPDGSGRVLTFTFVEHNGSNGTDHFYSADYQMTGTTPVIVTLPWSAFGADKTNVTAVDQQVWSVKGSPGPGTIYVDKIELIKIGTASPLSSIVVTAVG